jgi:hypothetical protein
MHGTGSTSPKLARSYSCQVQCWRLSLCDSAKYVVNLHLVLALYVVACNLADFSCVEGSAMPGREYLAVTGQVIFQSGTVLAVLTK